MPVFDIFSKRQKRIRGEVPDVFQYEDVPHELRVQVIHILVDSLGKPYYNSFDDLCFPDGTYEAFKFVHQALCREYGIFTFDANAETDYDRIENFFLTTEEAEKAIDVIELSLQYVDPIVCGFHTLDISPEEAIDELNQRFREHGIGYQYESGQMIRVDSQFIHSKAVLPALKILSASMYEGANAEFLSAHEHYRAKKHKECLNDCLKAFESCLKAICDKRGWAYGGKDTGNRLVEIVLKNKFIPDFRQSQFSALRETLKAGVPTIRSELGGHGQGSQEIHIPEHIAAYTLHLTASNILLLAKADEKMLSSVPF